MAAPYSQDLRDKVLAACDRGMAAKEVADAFGVCRARDRRVEQRRRERGGWARHPVALICAADQ